MPDPLSFRREKTRRKYQRSLSEFVKAAWHAIEPTDLVWGWHLDAMCEHLEAQTYGHIKDLIINIPPRSSKSSIVSVLWPAWEWTFWPHQRWLCASYTDALALDLGMNHRRVITSDWYQGLWNDRVQLADDQQSKHRFDTTAGGSRISTGVGTMITGRGGLRIVVDDPHNTKGAESEVQRQGVIDWWRGTMTSRRNDLRKARRTIVMQRVHKQDLCGYLLEQGGWEHLCLPMRFEEKQRRVTSIGWTDPRTLEGELLQPERFPDKEVTALAREMGSYVSAGQLQQRPAPAEGGLFKREDWRRFRTPHTPPIDGRATVLRPVAFERLILSVDATFKDLETSDYVVILTIGVTGLGKYVVRCVRRKMGFRATCQAIRDEVNASHGLGYLSAIVIEDKANGSAIIETLRGEFDNVIEVNPLGGKLARAQAIQPKVEAGNVYLPDSSVDDAGWVGDFINEAADFPNGDNDDQVDALSQGILYLDGDSSASAVLEWASRGIDG